MKYYVEYYTWNSVGTKQPGWGIVGFAFRDQITDETIKKQLVPNYQDNFQVTNIVKL